MINHMNPSLLLQICGGTGVNECSECGGALCVLDQGQRKCGGPNCDGAVPVSQNASETAERARNQLSTLPSRLEESFNKAGFTLQHISLHLEGKSDKKQEVFRTKEARESANSTAK